MNHTQYEYAVIKLAKRILLQRLAAPGAALTSPELVVDYLRLHLLPKTREVFAVLFLDNQNRLITYEEMFLGTIDGATVYPREVVKAALQHNAAAVILGHNHPSGHAEESTADKVITERLVHALSLVDVKVLDHVIVCGEEYVSFAQRGLL